MHNELWGRAEILANFFVIIVFVNTLHPLTEVFHLLLLRVSKPQGFIALPFALDSLCNIILSFNAKSIVIFIVKVKNRAAGKKKNEYEMILISIERFVAKYHHMNFISKQGSLEARNYCHDRKNKKGP